MISKRRTPATQQTQRGTMLATSSRELPLGLNDVVLVFACNELFVPYLSVALQSILVNTSPERHYDIVVLTRDITSPPRA